ncbi:hypothetical protein [Litchfieldella rifensis]|uniref:Transmembrane protein n=1 Tax=Litchfieldella rifensis TaxID=762643 RepID=A0ABV7LSZ3_9GAMM
MTAANRQRWKLIALIAVFVAPLATAWVMVEWRLGVPEERTAHGELNPDVPPLAQWPLRDAPHVLEAGDWVMAFDCPPSCDALADQWWRLHRALGREAPRVTRLRIGDAATPLPGEVLGQWQEAPDWQSDGQLWLLDPRGKVVLSYTAGAEPDDVLDDLNRLLRMNPDKPENLEG